MRNTIRLPAVFDHSAVKPIGPLYQPVPVEQSDQAQEGRGGAQNNQSEITAVIEHAAHHDASHHRWSSRDQRKEQKRQDTDFRDSGGIDKQILWNSGDQKDDEQSDKRPLLVQGMQKLGEFFFSEDHLERAFTQQTGQIERKDCSQSDSDDGK